MTEADTSGTATQYAPAGKSSPSACPSAITVSTFKPCTTMLQPIAFQNT